MSAQEQVAKLEALLARVNTRRGAPRAEAELSPGAVRAAAATPAQPVVEAKPIVPVAAPSRPKVEPTPVAAASAPAPAVAVPRRPAAPPPAPVTPAPMTPALVTPVTPVAVVAAAPPPAAKTVPPPAPDLEVSVEEGVAEIDLDGLDEPVAEGLSDSVADLDTVATGASKDEDDLPASSRRPIHVEAREPEVETKPHPVPPESRRQVAIPPADFEEDLLKSGVRALPEVAPTTAKAAPAAFQADVTRPAAVHVASPAVFRGAVPDVRPATFGELLDATLKL